MAFLLERDALNGKSGSAFATIDGRNIEIFNLKNFQTEANFQEADFKVVGTKLVQKKTTGVELTGSMDMYYGSPEYVRLVENFLNDGSLPIITLQITNYDPATSVGTQTVAFFGVKLQRIPIAMLDADTDYLVETVNFSFTSFALLSEFNDPTELGN